MALSAYFVEDPITRIVSITIGVAAGVEQFLYSDRNGMLASSDGFTWKPAASSVPAIAMAYGDGVWIAVGLDASMWRSEDYTKTWKSISGTDGGFINALAYIKPKGQPPDQHGVFAAATVYGDIHASFDLGETWEQVYVIPEVDDYSINPNAFSGCGGRFYLCTGEAADADLSSGFAHISSDGRSWSRISVFPGGSTDYLEQEVRITKDAWSITFDQQNELFYAIGFDQHSSNTAGTDNKVIYATSSDGLSFAGENLIKSTHMSGTGELIEPAGESAGAGMGRFATLMTNLHAAGGIGGTTGYVEATVGPGGQVLFNMGDLFDGQNKAQVFKGDVWFCVTNKETGSGVFACTAFDLYLAGGIWASTGGGWTKTHSGVPFHDGNQNSLSRVGLAVGNVVLASEVTPP